jgi:histidinol phosphatase-like enzyme (inositol monophosphatase family)
MFSQIQSGSTPTQIRGSSTEFDRHLLTAAASGRWLWTVSTICDTRANARDMYGDDVSLDELTAFALRLAQHARKETLSRFGKPGPVDDKGSGGLFDPVTDADRAAEQTVRRVISEHFPSHAVTGEEWPDHAGSSEYLWSLDPIDGTRSFICGLPTWTTLIALMRGGRHLLGLVDVPRLDETYIGADRNAWLIRNGKRSSLRTSGCTHLAEARLSSTDPAMFVESASLAFDRLRRGARTTRYGHDAYAYARLAAGSIDLVVESGLKPHDYNALIPLVTGAGGVIADWAGTQDYAGGNVIAAATPELFDEAKDYFAA